jgi:hypothetical protein
MLILDGTIPVDVTTFLQRINDETDVRDIITYSQWLNAHSHNCSHPAPRGIVYMRILPAIAHTRIQKRALTQESLLTLEVLEEIYAQQNQLFIEKQGLSSHLQDLPVLVLNGNIDFQTDFAQFYNHLFYIKRLIKDIQDKEDLARGIVKEKPQRRCC